MHDWLQQTWYGGGNRGRWLLPLSWLFAAAAAIRRGAYRSGLLREYRPGPAVVIVGNLTVGGTGKTPLVMWLAQQLRDRGHRPGIISRGHLALRGNARRISPGASAAEAGDEPALMARLGLPLAVGHDRATAARLLEPECDVLVCDDGLQHYRLARDVEIAVVDGERGLGNGRRLPAGPLRESPRRLQEVDAIVVNGEGFIHTGAVSMRLAPAAAVSVQTGERRPLATFAGQPVHAVAAIGNPQRFFRMLAGQGIRAREHPWPDHQPLPASMLDFGDGRPVLLTGKDAVKLAAGTAPLAWAVEVTAEIDAAGAERIIGLVEAAILRRGRRD